MATEAAVAQALRRGLRNQFVAGRFDDNVWSEIGAKDINSTKHQQIQREAGLQVSFDTNYLSCRTVSGVATVRLSVLITRRG